jgi:hypothetical protein
VNILAYIDTTGPNVRKQALQRDGLVARRVAPIVEHDVDDWRVLEEMRPKIRVTLISDKDSSNYLGRW